jgi:hypothetical protein
MPGGASLATNGIAGPDTWIQNNSGLSQGPVYPFGGRLSVLHSTPRESTMSEQATEESRDWASDIGWVVLYSMVVLLIMVLWVHVPA